MYTSVGKALIPQPRGTIRLKVAAGGPFTGRPIACGLEFAVVVSKKAGQLFGKTNWTSMTQRVVIPAGSVSTRTAEERL